MANEIINTLTPLEDKNFLKKIDKLRVRNHRVKLTLLDWNTDTPLTDFNNNIITIEGQATGGTINVNGKSSIRRSGSISLVLKNDQADITNIDNIISINKKVKVEVGCDNTTDEYVDYPIILTDTEKTEFDVITEKNENKYLNEGEK